MFRRNKGPSEEDIKEFAGKTIETFSTVLEQILAIRLEGLLLFAAKMSEEPTKEKVIYFKGHLDEFKDMVDFLHQMGLATNFDLPVFDPDQVDPKAIEEFQAKLEASGETINTGPEFEPKGYL